jgi:multisubunit Na+/H+ antiporter MnhE subunit
MLYNLSNLERVVKLIMMLLYCYVAVIITVALSAFRPAQKLHPFLVYL